MSQIHQSVTRQILHIISTVTGNAGGPVGPDLLSNINIVGANPITVTGNPVLNTLTISIATATTAQIGATTLATNAETIGGIVNNHAVTPTSLAAKLGAQTVNAIAYGAGAAAPINWLGPLTNGQLIIGSTGNPPVAAGITAGNNIGILTGAGSLTVNVNGTTDHAVQVGNITNSLTSLVVGTNGQVLIAANGADPAFATITSAGGTITFTPGANSLNMEVATFGLMWSREAGAAIPIINNHGYINTNVGLTTFTLPAVAAVGTEFAILGESAGGWIIAQNVGQNIQIGLQSTTPGAGGSLASTNAFDSVHLICRVANTAWQCLSSPTGNLAWV